MPRKPSQTDTQLIHAALELLNEKGFEGLKVRSVVQKAGVNLGMFHYHFKTKEEFQRRVLMHLYEQFFKDFSLESGGEGECVDRLRRALHALARFIRENRTMLIGLFLDAFKGNRLVVSFVTENFPRHARVIIRLIEECQKQGRMDKKPFYVVLPHCIGALAVPNIIVGVLERMRIRSFLGVGLALFKNQLLSDEAIHQRIDVVFRGLGVVEGGKP